MPCEAIVGIESRVKYLPGLSGKLLMASFSRTFVEPGETLQLQAATPFSKSFYLFSIYPFLCTGRRFSHSVLVFVPSISTDRPVLWRDRVPREVFRAQVYVLDFCQIFYSRQEPLPGIVRPEINGDLGSCEVRETEDLRPL